MRQGAKRLLFGQVETETETTPGLLIPVGGVARRSSYSVVCGAQMVAGALDHIDYEGSVRLIQLRKPRCNFGGLIVRLGGCLGQQLANAHAQAMADLFECL